MPKLHTYCPPNAYIYIQETRESNNISGMFQNFLLTELVCFATANLIFCLLELTEESSWCKTCCCIRPLSLTSLGGRRFGSPAKEVSCHLQRSLRKYFLSGICQILSALLSPPHPPTYPRPKATKTLKTRLFGKHKTYERYKYIWENILQHRIFSISWRKRQLFLLS